MPKYQAVGRTRAGTLPRREPLTGRERAGAFVRRGVVAVLRRAGPAIAWAGVIFVFSAQSELPQSPSLFAHLLPVGAPPELTHMLDHLVRKAGHFTEYAILAVLVYRALGLAPAWSPNQRYAAAWLIATLYAASDELHQAFVPGRVPAITDVAIDACGAAFALTLHRLVTRRRSEQVRTVKVRD